MLICPHFPGDNCARRKPKTQLVLPWLEEGVLDKAHSYVIGDRATDLELADNMGITGLRYDRETLDWPTICEQLTRRDRYAHVERITKETQVDVKVWLDREGGSKIHTGVGFLTICSTKSPPTAASAWRLTSAAICTSTTTTRWRIPAWPSAKP